MKITYTKELLEIMNIFSRATGATVKDCFEIDDVLYVVVEQGNVGKAVGKKGALIKELQFKLKKRIRVIEFSADMAQFVKNVVYPLAVDVGEDEGIVVLKSDAKGKLIGRNAKHLNMVERVTKRYFPISGMRVE